MKITHHQAPRGHDSTGRVPSTLIACAKGGSTASSRTTAGGTRLISMWTHNAGNKNELAAIKRIVTTTTPARPTTRSTFRLSRRTPTTSPSSRPRPPRSCRASSTSTGRTCRTGPGLAISPRWRAWTTPFEVPANRAREVERQDVFLRLLRCGADHCQPQVDPGEVRHPDPHRRPARGRRTSSRPALNKIKDCGDFDYPLDIATSFTGEWWPYAYSPFLQSFGGDLINRDRLQVRRGRAERARRRSSGPSGSAAW